MVVGRVAVVLKPFTLYESADSVPTGWSESIDTVWCNVTVQGSNQVGHAKLH